MGTVDLDSLIWHYTNSNGLLGMVEGRQLWATHFQFMNDTLEGTLLTKPLKNYIETSDALTRSARELLKNMLYAYEGVPRHIVTRVPDGNQFLLCGSTSGDELTLWRNYARDSVSFAVGLDPSVPLGVIPPRKNASSYSRILSWQEVDYQQHTSGLPEKYAKLIMEAVHKDDLGDQISHVSSTLEQIFALVKEASFKDERESRVVALVDEPRHWRFRNGRFGITPYVSLGTSNKWGTQSDGSERLPIRAVRLSANASPADHLALNALLESNGFEGGVHVTETEDQNNHHAYTEYVEQEPDVVILQSFNSLRG